METLPQSILQYIYTFLNLPDAARFSRICHDSHRAFIAHWYMRELNHGIPEIANLNHMEQYKIYLYLCDINRSLYVNNNNLYALYKTDTLLLNKPEVIHKVCVLKYIKNFYFTCYGRDVPDFPNLCKLICSSSGLNKLNISGANLTKLYCEWNKLTILDCDNFVNLEILVCKGNALKILDCRNCTKLSFIDCGRNILTHLQFHAESLISLYCNHNKLTNLDLRGTCNLKLFNCRKNSLKILNLNDSFEIKHLDFNRNNIVKFNITNCLKLTDLICWGNELRELKIKNCIKLKNIDCKFNNLKYLNLYGVKPFIRFQKDENTKVITNVHLNSI
jgi:hypothetical protein